MRRLFFVSLLCFLLVTSSSPAASHAQGDEVSWLLAQLNCLRQSVGVAPLTLNASLMASANQQSTYLANNKPSDMHVQPDGSTPLSRAKAAGFNGYVGENVVRGASPQRAFSWWQGDDIHYRNMVNAYWSEVGIGIVSGTNGTWYTTDFGTASWKIRRIPAAPCGSFSPPASSAGNNGPSNTSGSGGPVVLKQPDYVAGLDEYGNIKHQVQPGDTVGSIAYIYGYTWDDIPKLLTLNNMTDTRSLKIGAIFLVPPKNGTFTPAPSTPNPEPTATAVLPTATETPIPPTATASPLPSASATVKASATFTSTVSQSPTHTAISTAISLIATILPEPMENSQPTTTNPIRNLIPWLILLNGILLAGLFIRPLLRRHR